jgi:hypothetical protein
MTKKPYPRWLPAATIRFTSAVIVNLGDNKTLGLLADNTFIASEKRINPRRPNFGYHVLASAKTWKLFRAKLPAWLQEPNGIFYLPVSKHACLFAASAYEMLIYCAESCIDLWLVTHIPTKTQLVTYSDQIIMTSSNEAIPISRIKKAQVFRRVQLSKPPMDVGWMVQNPTIVHLEYHNKTLSQSHAMMLPLLSQFTFASKLGGCFYKRKIKTYSFPEAKATAIGIDTVYTIEEFQFYYLSTTPPTNEEELAYLKYHKKDKPPFIKFYVVYGYGYINDKLWEHISLAPSLPKAQMQIIDHQETRMV